MYRNGHTSRQQLRPNRQIHLSLQTNINPEAQSDQASNRQTRHQLTPPRYHGGIKCHVEIIRLVLVIKGKIGVDVLVGAKVQYEDGAEEGNHGSVLREEADEDVTDLEFLVSAVAEGCETENGENAVEDRSHLDGGNDDQAS